MSRAKQRSEKNCLNCNAVVHGRFCSVCGQENLQPQESIWHLFTHFFNDFTHFDGKFFDSMKYLVRRPGFLSQEYMDGRRATYLNPVRMYIFTSAIFFLFYFSFFLSPDHRDGIGTTKMGTRDSVELKQELKAAGIDSVSSSHVVLTGNSPLTATGYRDRKAYDSLLQAGVVHDNFIMRAWRHRQFSIKDRYGNNDDLLKDKLSENFQHYTPQMFFLSLPLFALFLEALYLRRRKRFYYVAHFIFTLHLYVFVYIAVAALLTLNSIASGLHLSRLSDILTLLTLGIFYYAYRAMRVFYDQGRGKTILKFLLLLGWLLFLFVFLTVVMLFFSLFKI